MRRQLADKLAIVSAVAVVTLALLFAWLRTA